MSFALVGDLITQTGTDLNLSGLSAIAGVTTVSSNNRAIYSLNGLRLKVDGDLTIDPELEELFFYNYADNITLHIDSGTLTIGRTLTSVAEKQRHSSGTAIRFAGANTHPFLETSADIRIESTGTVHWFGGTVFSRRVFAIYGTLITYSKEAKFIGQHTGEVQIRQVSNTVQLNGFVYTGHALTLMANALSIKGVEPYSPAIFALGLSGQTPNNVFLEFEELDPRGLGAPLVGYWANKWIRLINNFTGSDFQAVGNSPSQANNLGLVEVRQDLVVRIVDATRALIDNVKVHLTDTDNGNRLGANQIRLNPSYLETRDYAGISSDGIVEFTGSSNILVAVHWRTVGGDRFQNNEIDYRCVSGNSTDDFSFWLMSYLEQLTELSTVLKGGIGKDRSVTMLPDFSITQQDKMVVDSYLEIDTPVKFYDRAKAWLYDNFTGQTRLLANRNGNLINLGSNNLVIDASASTAFAVSGSTITIRATTFLGNLTTTGTITLVNGALVDGIRTDANNTVAPELIASVTINGLPNGARVQLYDTNSGTELVNGIDATTWAELYSVDRNIRLRAMYMDGTTAIQFIDQQIGTITSATPSITTLVSPVTDTVYQTNGVDGSLVTGVTIDDNALLVEVSTGTLSWAELYAYETFWLFTEEGIRDEQRFATAIDPANYVWHDFKLKNVTSPLIPITITGGYGRDAATGTSIALLDTTGGPIFMAPDIVIPYASGAEATVGIVQAGLTAQGLTPAVVAEVAKESSVQTNIALTVSK